MNSTESPLSPERMVVADRSRRMITSRPDPRSPQCLVSLRPMLSIGHPAGQMKWTLRVSSPIYGAVVGAPEEVTAFVRPQCDNRILRSR